MTPGQIADIRRFNRLYTQRIGLLEHDFLGRGRPLAEARLIHEIGSAGIELKRLRSRLSLDSGYLSRLLRSLQRQKLVRIAVSRKDRRQRTIELTHRGRREFGAYERLSDKRVETIGEPLTADERAALALALTEAARLVLKSSVTIAGEDPESEDARFCVESYYRELDRRFDGGFDPATKAYAGDGDGKKPFVHFAVARIGDEAVACGSLVWRDQGIGEIKRMWVAPQARGLGIAKRLLAHLEEVGRKKRLRFIQLDTNRALVEAQTLYRRAGYREIARYSDNPYAHHWFGKDL